MDGEQNGQNKEADTAPEVSPRGAPNTSNGTNINEQHTPISEQAFVDRINASDRWMIFLTGAIVATGVLSAVIFWWQLGVMHGQLDEMRDEQRPWLAVTPTLTGALVNDGTKLRINTRIEIKNVGHSPALEVASSVQVTWRPMIIKGGYNRLERFCAVDEPSTLWIFFNLTPADIVFPEGGDTFDSEAKTVENKDISFEKGVSVSETKGIDLMFCVSYKSFGSSVRHRTGGIASIVPSSNSDLFLKSGGSIPVNSLKLARPTVDAHSVAD